MSNLPAPPTAGFVVIPESAIPDRRGVFSCLSHVSRDGEWILARRFRVLAWMGNVKLDLTRVLLGAGTTEIEAIAVMGEVRILVPPGLRVECDGDPLLGEFSIKRIAGSAPPADAPLVRITGRAILGSVKIKVVDPTAPSWLDRLSRRRT